MKAPKNKALGTNGLFALMIAAASAVQADNAPPGTSEDALTELCDTMEYLHLNEADGDSDRVKLQNLAILEAQVSRFAAILLPSLTPEDIAYLIEEATGE